MSQINKYIIFIFLIFYVSVAVGQSDSTSLNLKTIDESTYHELVKEVIYEKEGSKLLPRKFERKKKKKKEKEKKKIDTSFINPGVMKIVMYAIIAILVLFVIWMLLGSINLKGKDKDLDLEIVEDQDIEDIEAVDTDSGYRQAMEAKNYRLACRMIFLKVLQRLEVTEKIRWKKEKTNRHYIREMSEDENSEVFRLLVNIYEKVWYGDKGIDLEGLQQYVREAQRFVTIKFLADGE